jgi:hypothetical protein
VAEGTGAPRAREPDLASSASGAMFMEQSAKKQTRSGQAITNTDDARFMPSRILTISKAGMKGLVSLFSPETKPAASSARTARAAK